MIRRELGIFLIVGALTVAVDFITYRMLMSTNLVSLNVAKAVGFLTGSTFAYFSNRFWTFGHRRHTNNSAWRFTLLYAATLAANVAINWIALSFIAGLSGAMQIAFVIATGASATLNFLGMKLYVFKPSKVVEMA